MNPNEFFGEPRRRNVYKVAVAYAVVGWLLVQVVTQVFPIFEIPARRTSQRCAVRSARRKDCSGERIQSTQEVKPGGFLAELKAAHSTYYFNLPSQALS